MKASIALVMASTALAAADAPSGYQCQPGAPKKGVGCVCPPEHVDRRVEENIAVCAYVPKASEAAVIKAECKKAVAGVSRAFGTGLAGDERKTFVAAFDSAVQQRCEVNTWPGPVRKCFAAVTTEEAAWECVDKLPPVQRGGLEADTARLHPIGVAVTKTSLELKGALVFARTQPTLSATSSGLLDLVARTLHQHPAIKLEIQAHSDNVEEDRQRLTQGRAEAVKRALVARGVAAARLVARGYAELRPAASNATAWSRAKNRRIELAITSGAARAVPAKDRDRDLIADADDKCPDVPETFDGTADEDGCPEQARSELPTISFASSSAALDTTAKLRLDEAAKLLGNRDVRIVGHTDQNEVAGAKLGLARAKAARDYLVGKGIAAARLSIESPAGKQPIASNTTPDGRAQNRRVELLPK